jgi:hypothetical protein
MKETTIEKYSYTNKNSRRNLAFANCRHFQAKGFEKDPILFLHVLPIALKNMEILGRVSA